MNILPVQPDEACYVSKRNEAILSRMGVALVKKGVSIVKKRVGSVIASDHAATT